jgi:hypothetical protein
MKEYAVVDLKSVGAHFRISSCVLGSKLSVEANSISTFAIHEFSLTRYCCHGHGRRYSNRKP